MDVLGTGRWRRVAEIAAKQHGRITVEQLHAAGAGRSSIEKAVASGRLHREHVGVYAVGHAQRTDAARWISAVLACGPDAHLSHRPATLLWGIGQWEGRSVDVTNPTGGGRRRAGIRVHHSPLPDADRAVRDGIRVTSVARTIADVAHVCSAKDLSGIVREAQFRALFDLTATVIANARRPSRALSRLLDDLQPTESPIEDEFLLKVVARHRLPPPVCQLKTKGFRADFAWPEARLIVEAYGAHHANPVTAMADATRDNVLGLGGDLVLRYYKPDITRHHARTAAQIRQAIRERRP